MAFVSHCVQHVYFWLEISCNVWFSVLFFVAIPTHLIALIVILLHFNFNANPLLYIYNNRSMCMVWKPLVSMTFRLCCKNIRFFTYLCWYCWTISNVNFPHIFHYGKLMFVREFTKYSSTCKTNSCDISQAPTLKHPTTIPEKNTYEKNCCTTVEWGRNPLEWSEEEMWQKK